jgi:hypothetical protein
MTRAGVFVGLGTPARIVGTVAAGLVFEAAVVWRF